MQKKSNDFDTCYYLGYACFQNKDYAHAIPCLKKALVVNPEASVVYEPLGKALYNAGNTSITVIMLMMAPLAIKLQSELIISISE